jgi:hypothetical protein
MTSHFTSITRQQIYVLTSQHIAYSIRYRSATRFSRSANVFFRICIMCQETLTPRIKPIQPPWLFVVSNPSDGIFIFDLYIVTFFSFLSCSFIQFNVHTSSVGHFIFSSVIPWPPYHYFFLSHASIGFFPRYTYKHHCIYASQDLKQSEFKTIHRYLFQTSFPFFIYLSHLVALSWPAVLFNSTNLDLFRYPMISVSHLFLHLHFQSAYLFKILVYRPYDIKTVLLICCGCAIFGELGCDD